MGSLSGCIGRAWEEDLADWHGHVRPIASTQDVTPARIEWEEDKTALADLSLQLSISSLGGRPCFIPFPRGRKAGQVNMVGRRIWADLSWPEQACPD